MKAHRLRGVHLNEESRTQPENGSVILRCQRDLHPAQGQHVLATGVVGKLSKFRANLVGSIKPEPWADRRGRLLGNCIALKDLVTGRIDPKKIMEHVGGIGYVCRYLSYSGVPKMLYRQA